MLAKEVCPEIERHVSTQANNTNYGTYQFWWNLGEMCIRDREEIDYAVSVMAEVIPMLRRYTCLLYTSRCV